MYNKKGITKYNARKIQSLKTIFSFCKSKEYVEKDLRRPFSII